jgi:hypothetical protein
LGARLGREIGFLGSTLVFLGSFFVGNFVEKESIQPVMLTHHELKVYEKSFPPEWRRRRAENS